MWCVDRLKVENSGLKADVKELKSEVAHWHCTSVEWHGQGPREQYGGVPWHMGSDHGMGYHGWVSWLGIMAGYHGMGYHGWVYFSCAKEGLRARHGR